MSPTRLSSDLFRLAALSCQRTFSPPNPPSNSPARSICFFAVAACSSRSAFFCCVSLSVFCSRATRSSTACRAAFLLASSFIVTASESSASFRAAFFGSMPLATLSYTTMARTHMHRHIAAEDCFLISSGRKRGSLKYLSTFLMVFGGMLSLS